MTMPMGNLIGNWHDPGRAEEPPVPDLARHHQHALYVLRSRELREKAGLVW